MGLTFNQTTAIFGILYASVLFYFFRKLKAVWKREQERARYGMVLFTLLFAFSAGTFFYVYYVLKKKRTLERVAADLIDKQKQKPFKVTRVNYFSKLIKVGSALMLTFIALHRIMRRT